MRRCLVRLEENGERHREGLAFYESSFQAASAVAGVGRNPSSGISPIFADGKIPRQHVVDSLGAQAANDFCARFRREDLLSIDPRDERPEVVRRANRLLQLRLCRTAGKTAVELTVGEVPASWWRT